MELIVETSRALAKCPLCLSKEKKTVKNICPNPFHRCNCHNGYNCKLCLGCIFNKPYKTYRVCLLNDVCNFHDKKVTKQYLRILDQY